MRLKESLNGLSKIRKLIYGYSFWKLTEWRKDGENGNEDHMERWKVISKIFQYNVFRAHIFEKKISAFWGKTKFKEIFLEGATMYLRFPFLFNIHTSHFVCRIFGIYRKLRSVMWKDLIYTKMKICFHLCEVLMQNQKKYNDLTYLNKIKCNTLLSSEHFYKKIIQLADTNF